MLLRLVLGNENSFKIVLNGILKYKYIKFEELIDEDFKRTMHSLKRNKCKCWSF